MNLHFHLDAMAVILAIGGLYGYGLIKFRPRPRWLHPIERRQVILFSMGLLTLYAAEASPLHDLSEQYLFSAHMTQHMLLTLIMPPLLLLGTPSWLLRPLLTRRFIFPVTKVLTNPVVAIVLFNGVLALWHIPNLYEATLLNHNVHVLNHLVYIFTAILLWWPIFSPLPELPPINYPLQMVYLFVQSLMPAILASMITFSETVLYPTYALAPRILDIDPITDQQIGGLIMKFLGSIIMWTLGTVIFFHWFNHEEAQPEQSWD